jgi:succinoglycan biosynthesis protein ExoA
MKDFRPQAIPDGVTPAVSVVVPCRNESDHVATCVAGLLELEAPAGGFEVVVADGISYDGTRNILRGLAEKDSRLKVIDNPERIASAGLNAAIRAAQGEIIVRADAHTEYAPDYLLRCLDAMQRVGADNVGGPARTKADGWVQRAIAAAYSSPFSAGGAKFHDPNYEGYVDTVTYGCWRRSAFERFGYFDEELARNQDDEHNLRIRRGGGKIWQCPKIKSWYKPRASLGGLFKQYMQYGYWKVRVIQKHHLPASPRHLVPGGFVLALGILALLSPFFFLARIALLVAVGFYALGVLVASVATAARTEWKLLRVLPLVFACYHFGYGCGFLCGIWDFVFRRGQPRANFSHLTR